MKVKYLTTKEKKEHKYESIQISYYNMDFVALKPELLIKLDPV